MPTIPHLRRLLSKLRQNRCYLEKHIEQVPKMLPACLILRYRRKGTMDFQSVKAGAELTEMKSYAYLTYLDAGITRHRYIAKSEIGEVAKLTEAYRMFCKRLQSIRAVNNRIVEVLVEIGKIQQEEVKGYVQRRVKRNRKSE